MMRFLLRYCIKAVVYYGILLLFMVVGLLDKTSLALIVPALILAAVNTVIRPLLVTLALPFNVLLFGVASLFANLLSLVIASAIAGGALTTAFWIMLLIALAVMLADDGIRIIRKTIRLKRLEA